LVEVPVLFLLGIFPLRHPGRVPNPELIVMFPLVSSQIIKVSRSWSPDEPHWSPVMSDSPLLSEIRLLRVGAINSANSTLFPCKSFSSFQESHEGTRPFKGFRRFLKEG